MAKTQTTDVRRLVAQFGAQEADIANKIAQYQLGKEEAFANWMEAHGLSNLPRPAQEKIATLAIMNPDLIGEITGQNEREVYQRAGFDPMQTGVAVDIPTSPDWVNDPGLRAVGQDRRRSRLVSGLPDYLAQEIMTGLNPKEQAEVGKLKAETPGIQADTAKKEMVNRLLAQAINAPQKASFDTQARLLDIEDQQMFGGAPPALQRGGLPPPSVISETLMRNAIGLGDKKQITLRNQVDPTGKIKGPVTIIMDAETQQPISIQPEYVAPAYGWQENIPGPGGKLYRVPFDANAMPDWTKAIEMAPAGKAEGEKPVGQSAKDWINPATGQNPAPTTPVSELNIKGFIPTATAPVEFQTIPASDRKNYVNIDGKSAPANLRTPAEAAESGYELVGDPQEIQRRIQVAEARPMVIKYLKTIAKLFPLSSGGVLGQAGRLAESKYQAYKRDDPAWADFEKFKFTLIEPVARAVAKSLGAVREDDNKRAQAAMAKAGDDPAVAHSHARELARAFNIPEEQINSALGGAEPKSYQQKSYKSLWE